MIVSLLLSSSLVIPITIALVIVIVLLFDRMLFLSYCF